METKDKKIAQLEKENRETQESVVQKLQSIQSQLKANQENNYKRKLISMIRRFFTNLNSVRQSLDAKEEEVTRLNKKIADLSKELLIAQNEVELLSKDRKRIESDKVTNSLMYLNFPL